MKKLLIGLAAVGAIALTACGPDNVAACTAYVEHFNGLECLADGADIDAASTCPDSLNSGADLTGYYNCLIENSTCDGETLDTSGTTDCTTT
jgi:hypothetical protein